MTVLAPTLQGFFTDRLIRQRHASPQTISGYRDTWRLLLGFAEKRIGKPPSTIDFDDLDAPLVSAFLDHLEQERGNSVRTRNARLAAIHSLFRYAALRHPEHAATIARILRASFGHVPHRDRGRSPAARAGHPNLDGAA
jgi:site-specific recombinase XerD